MQVQGFVIHLGRATQRRPQVERLLQGLPMPTEIIDAVDGHALTQAQIDAVYRPGMLRPRYPFSLGKGEIGCFLSHRKAWQQIVDRGLDAGLVVEDDVEIGEEPLARLLDLVRSVARPSDLVRFPQQARVEKGELIASANGFSVVEPAYPNFGMIMQLVGRDAAAALLELTRTFDRPVDAVVQMRWLHKIRILSARPSVISEISRELGGSLAQSGRRRWTDTLRRELQRPLYRLSVRMRAALHRSGI